MAHAKHWFAPVMMVAALSPLPPLPKCHSLDCPAREPQHSKRPRQHGGDDVLAAGARLSGTPPTAIGTCTVSAEPPPYTARSDQEQGYLGESPGAHCQGRWGMSPGRCAGQQQRRRPPHTTAATPRCQGCPRQSPGRRCPGSQWWSPSQWRRRTWPCTSSA